MNNDKIVNLKKFILYLKSALIRATKWGGTLNSHLNWILLEPQSGVVPLITIINRILSEPQCGVALLKSQNYNGSFM